MQKYLRFCESPASVRTRAPFYMKKATYDQKKTKKREIMRIKKRAPYY